MHQSDSDNGFYGGNLNEDQASLLFSSLCTDAVINICACGNERNESAQKLADATGAKVCYCSGSVSSACHCDGAWICVE